MTLEESELLQCGIYLVFWTNGNMSKAVLNKNEFDKLHISCHNWIGGFVPFDRYLTNIEKMIFIM